MQNWPMLKTLWQRHCDPTYQASARESMEWEQQKQALYANQIAHPVTLRFLLQERPTLEEFHDWIAYTSAQYQVTEDKSDIDNNRYLLSAEEIAFWQENGYLVLHNVIDAAACTASCNAIWQYIGATLQETSSWYQPQCIQHGLMLPLYNHPQLNSNRASQRIRAAYAQLYGSEALYKTIDHVSFNPPETPYFSFRGSTLHWDFSIAQPIPERYQGLLYLTDCASSDGAFHCVPGFHHQIADWLRQFKPGDNIRQIAAETLATRAVPGNAGDFIIWHQALPHCATPNHGQTPRMVQYLTYIPTNHVEHSIWI
ncbi:phytanoyl-CoA dioxygenase family protein [Undibacterium sp. SXout7W]|uniref:phytanoyl-CoA dioxygenase family protein n=1 Tax=Undibacterium sp. SXout7W TaxID=3413049 RepID=UPI003BEF9CB1